MRNRHTMNDHAALLETLTHSATYREYERAFTDATGLPLALRSPGCWQPPFRGKAKENGFCALMAKNSPTCAACLRMQERIEQEAADKTVVLKCHFGMTEAAVPVKVGTATIGFLTTGQVLTQEVTDAQMSKMVTTLVKLGGTVDVERAKAAYRATRVLPRTQLLGMTHLLETFAEQLGTKSNAVCIRQANIEPVAIVRAKQFVAANLTEEIQLDDAAKAACVSRFYLCKLFKRHTGMHFTEFVSRMRVEKAKELLLNPNLRVSEIAFAAGFQSLTHFNRVFREVLGEPATAYRKRLAVPLAA